MLVSRRVRAALAIASVATVLVAAGCSSTETDTSTSVGTSIEVAAVLGAPNPATGAPIKIGLVDDGKSAGIDHTPIVSAFNATVQYANEYLGGINGHVIEVVECATNNTPSDATSCGIQMVQEKVAAVLVPVSAQDSTVIKAIADSGIPYFTYAAGSQESITAANAFLLQNPLATFAGGAKLAKDNGVKKAGIIQIDVPAATGTSVIAKPIYTKAGVELDIVAISPQVADMTPQIQQAMSSGAEQFTVVGTDEFNTSGIKALKQLGFQGKIVLITAPTKEIVENVGEGGLEGVVYVTAATTDPSDTDVQKFNAVMQKFNKDATINAQSGWAYATLLGFVDALQGQTAAVDGATVSTALGSMPKQLPLPLGGGLTYQCGAKVVPLIPTVCTGNILSTTLDAEGNGTKYEVLDVAEYMNLMG